MKKSLVCAMSLGWIALAVAIATFARGPQQTGDGSSPVAKQNHKLDPNDFDTTCKPCQDFFQFATGGWTKRNPIQAAYPSYGRFNELQNKNQEVLHQILEAAAKNKHSVAGSTEQKIGDFYGSCMDIKRIEKQGVKPLEPELKRIAQITTLAQMEDVVAGLHVEGFSALFRFDSTQDDKDSTQVIGIAEQGGLGLPDRDYYTKTDDPSKQLRDQYEQHVARMLSLAGDPGAIAAAEARTVVSIETQLAQASKTRVERRDPASNYHKMEAADMRALTPNFSWEQYFRNVGFLEIHQVNVAQPEFFQALDKQLNSVPLADWKVYLRWHVIHSAANGLSSKFVNENFDFYGRKMTGVTELQPRWKRCVSATDRNLGQALGQKYVAQTFPPEAKARARALVINLIAALRSDLQTLPWMSEQTRQQALAKLSAMSLKIGYPDKWRDYSSYEVIRGAYLVNLERGSGFEFHRSLTEIGKPVDRTEWDMSPPTVNAYYNANMNEIVFPAGILQSPFFDSEAEDAQNYGGIGAVIGHEMTHGFDDQGAQYDAQGNLRDWWTPEDLKNFKERAECVQKQFDGFQIADGLHENGKLVEGESIADLGGLTIAHMAFERTLAGKAMDAVNDGYTPEQRFFLSFARIWAITERPEYERMLVSVDPHPLPRFRVNASLMNVPTFAAAFYCQAGDAMMRPADQVCKIW